MRWRLGALVGVCAALWIDSLAGGGLVSSTAAVVVVASVSVAAGLRSEPVPLAAAGFGSAALLAVADQLAEPGRFALASDGVFYCIVVLAPAFLGRLIADRNRQVALLQERRRALELRRDVAVRVARAVERDRIERRVDLSLVERLRQLVTGIAELADCVAARPERVPAELAALEDVARAALAELRGVLGTLHVASAPPAESVGTPATVARSRPRVRVGWADAALLVAAVPLAVETALPGHHGPVVLNVPAALAQGAALVVLRRRPLPGVVVLLAVAVVQTAELAALPPTVSWFLPGLLAAFLLGVGTSRWTSWAGLVVLLVGVVATTYATPAGHRATGGLVPGLVMGLLVWTGGRLAAARRARAHELAAINERLDRDRTDEARLAALDQRAAIARDLHDAGAHALTVVCLQAGAALAWWDRDRTRARAAVATLVTVADSTLAHVGRSFGGLARGTGHDVLGPEGLEVLIDTGRALGLTVDVAVTGRPRPVPAEVGTVAYRVVQEGLTNAARHAPGSSVSVGLAYTGGALEVRVSDTGADAASRTVVPVAGAAAGLRGMRERVEALRGELRADRSGRGFEILARLPT